MPTTTINGCDYYYEIHGTGADTIVLAHGMLWSGKVFKHQVDFLKKHYRVITYDHRGQGRSEVTESGYDIDSLTRDAIKLIEFLDIGKVHFLGLSMGGFVAMRIAARRPDLINSLILMGTSAEPEAPSLKYSVMRTLVKLFGIKVVSAAVMNIYFAKKFLKDPQRKQEYDYWKKELEANPKTVLKAADGVLTRKGVEQELANINCPSLIMVGSEDIATTPEKAQFIHEHIEGSILKIIPQAGHTPGVETTTECNQIIEEFLTNVK